MKICFKGIPNAKTLYPRRLRWYLFSMFLQFLPALRSNYPLVRFNASMVRASLLLGLKVSMRSQEEM